MNKSKIEQLKQLILKEMALRKEFKEAREKLESLANEINIHNKKACEFWATYLPNDEECLVTERGITLKLVRPKREDFSIDTLSVPFGLNFSKCTVIEIIT